MTYRVVFPLNDVDIFKSFGQERPSNFLGFEISTKIEFSISIFYVTLNISLNKVRSCTVDFFKFCINTVCLNYDDNISWRLFFVSSEFCLRSIATSIVKRTLNTLSESKLFLLNSLTSAPPKVDFFFGDSKK